MNMKKMISKGDKIGIPYDENMVIKSMNGEFNHKELKNVIPKLFDNSIKVTRLVKAGKLYITFNNGMNKIDINYMNNDTKDIVTVNSENIGEINLWDTHIELTQVGDSIEVSIESNDVKVDQDIIEDLQHTNEQLNNDYLSLKKQYDDLVKKNKELSTQIDNLKTNVEKEEKIKLKAEGECDRLSNNLTAAKNLVEGVDTKKEQLEKEYKDYLNDHNLDEKVVEEYNNEDKYNEIKKDLDSVKKQLDAIDGKIEKLIKGRQEYVDSITEKVKKQ